jgi:hypothetical protein
MTLVKGGLFQSMQEAKPETSHLENQVLWSQQYRGEHCFGIPVTKREQQKNTKKKKIQYLSQNAP